MIVIAHAAHWLTSIGFMIPPLAFMGWLAWVTVKERRKGGGDDQG